MESLVLEPKLYCPTISLWYSRTSCASISTHSVQIWNSFFSKKFLPDPETRETKIQAEDRAISFQEQHSFHLGEARRLEPIEVDPGGDRFSPIIGAIPGHKLPALKLHLINQYSH